MCPPPWQASRCLSGKRRHGCSILTRFPVETFPQVSSSTNGGRNQLWLIDDHAGRLELMVAQRARSTRGCATWRAGLARPRDGVRRLGVDVHRPRDRHSRPAAVPRDVGSPSGRGERSARFRASAGRSGGRSHRPPADRRRVRLRRPPLRDRPRLARLGTADRSRRRGCAARRDDPDLDGAVRPHRVREAAARSRVCRNRGRVRRSRIPLRSVRRGLGRPGRRARDRPRCDVLGRRLALLARRAVAEASARLGRARVAVRRDPPRRLFAASRARSARPTGRRTHSSRSPTSSWSGASSASRHTSGSFASRRSRWSRRTPT